MRSFVLVALALVLAACAPPPEGKADREAACEPGVTRACGDGGAGVQTCDEAAVWGGVRVAPGPGSALIRAEGSGN